MELNKVTVDDLESQFKELQADDEISAELAALKRRSKEKIKKGGGPQIAFLICGF